MTTVHHEGAKNTKTTKKIGLWLYFSWLSRFRGDLAGALA
jgi:hypothetical protein